MKKAFDTRRLVLLSVLCAILLVMSFTPLGYLNIGPLAISLNMIPVAIAAVAMGPVEGAILGGMFGITSFVQCLGIGGTSAMGVILFEISPVLAFVQRFVPRVRAGLLAGLAYKGVKKLMGHAVASFVTGWMYDVIDRPGLTYLPWLFWCSISLICAAAFIALYKYSQKNKEKHHA